MDIIKISIEDKNNIFTEGTRALCKKLGADLDKDGIKIIAEKSDKLFVSQNNGIYKIGYNIQVEFFRGLAICVNQIKNNKAENVVESRYFDTCGYMIDVSRNRVITVDTAKDLIEYLALMGINMLMLYTEDTYIIEKYPYFGYMRGAYTKEEIKEIDNYCRMFGIELIPCIQTLSHLETTLRWAYASEFANTYETLCVTEEKTYEFIEEMFKTIKECFSSKRIHIGLDEANDINEGKVSKTNGYISKPELMAKHLNRVCEIAKKYDLDPLMWSDMFYKFGTKGGDYDETSVIPEGYKEIIPENVDLVYWDYCFDDMKTTKTFIDRHRKDLDRNVIFAGGIWTWNRISTNYDTSFSTANNQLIVCKENNIKEVFVTTWNNTNSFCNLYSILPGLQLWAEHTYNKEVSKEQLSKMFNICTGCNLDDFMMLSFDDFSKEEKEKYMEEGCFCINSSVQHFFNDVLLGLFDKTFESFDFINHYKKYADGLKKINSYKGNFGDLFKQNQIIIDILLIKCEIGSNIVKAYKNNDRTMLNNELENLKKLFGLYKEYHRISMDIWFKQNKAFGWEGSDIVLGAVESRIESAIIRLEQFLAGDIKNLPELEAERLYFNGCTKPLTETNFYKTIMTAANI